MPFDPSLRDKIRATIEADYGQHTILPGNKVPPVRRLPSRSLAINYVTGGGYPHGMMTRLWGAFSSGKTSEIFGAMAQGQALGMSCLYVCTEKVFDESLPVRMGVDMRKLDLVRERKIEVIGEIVQRALAAYEIVAVDSTTGTMSIDELASGKGEVKEVGDNSETTGMNRARKWGYNMDWWQDRINPENVLIFTSQIQSSIGMSTRQRIAAERAPGGEKLNHEPALILHFMKAQQLKRKADGGLEPIGDSGGESGAFGRKQAAGGEVVVRCDKNKVGKQGRIALLHHDRTIADFDRLHEYEKLAKYFGVVQRSGGPNSSWYLLPDGGKAQSIRRAIEESPELARRIEDVVLRCARDPEYEDMLLRGGPIEEMVPGVA